MTLSIKKREEIKLELLQLIKKNDNAPAIRVSEKFGISKQSAYRYLKNLVKEGKISVKNSGRNKIYQLVTYATKFIFKIDGLEEDVVWKENIKPFISETNSNVLNACNYGFTEMLNNAIDHSNSEKVEILISKSEININFWITDYGIGIFNRIQKAFGLDNPRQSILELSKGKLTTDPSRHSGEGIFFTSRIFDDFQICSGELAFVSGRNGKIDVLFDDNNYTEGTIVRMGINKNSDVIISNVFDEYTAASDDFGFTKTHIPVHLSEHEGVMLVSRSQAKRLTSRFDKFKEVILDFDGVEEVGQAFTDELFRVFANQHPDVELKPINMNEKVSKMVFRAIVH